MLIRAFPFLEAIFRACTRFRQFNAKRFMDILAGIIGSLINANTNQLTVIVFHYRGRYNYFLEGESVRGEERGRRERERENNREAHRSAVIQIIPI